MLKKDKERAGVKAARQAKAQADEADMKARETQQKAVGCGPPVCSLC